MESDHDPDQHRQPSREAGANALPPERWEIIKSQTRRACARAARRRCCAISAGWLVRRVRANCGAGGFGAWWRRRSAVRELQGLDNRDAPRHGHRALGDRIPGRRRRSRAAPAEKAVARAPCAAPDAARSRNVTIERQCGVASRHSERERRCCHVRRSAPSPAGGGGRRCGSSVQRRRQPVDVAQPTVSSNVARNGCAG